MAQRKANPDAVSEIMSDSELLDAGQEVEVAGSNLPSVPDHVLRSISFDDLAAQDTADATNEYGTGFTVEDKTPLVGRPFYIIDARFNRGKMGDFVSLTCVAEGNLKAIINDGSTGILRQMRDIMAERARTGDKRIIFVKKGLRRSDYQVQDAKGSDIDATTFYLDF